MGRKDKYKNCSIQNLIKQIAEICQKYRDDRQKENEMAETKVLRKTRPLSELDAKMNPVVLVKARKTPEQESLNIWLTMLREKYGVKQNEISNFTQTAVSKLENRKDIRISTLIDYLDSLGMGLEIVAYPRNSTEKELLLRV